MAHPRRHVPQPGRRLHRQGQRVGPRRLPRHPGQARAGRELATQPQLAVRDGERAPDLLDRLRRLDQGRWHGQHLVAGPLLAEVWLLRGAALGAERQHDVAGHLARVLASRRQRQRRDRRDGVVRLPDQAAFDPSPSYEWNSWQDTSQVSTKAHFLGRPAVNEPIHRTWHTFGVNWSPTCLRYTLDGKTVGVARPIAGEVPYINGPTFNSPFHIRFNMQIGSHYWGWPDPSVTKDEFHYKVDWVRVYQKK